MISSQKLAKTLSKYLTITLNKFYSEYEVMNVIWTRPIIIHLLKSQTLQAGDVFLI